LSFAGPARKKFGQFILSFNKNKQTNKKPTKYQQIQFNYYGLKQGFLRPKKGWLINKMISNVHGVVILQP